MDFPFKINMKIIIVTLFLCLMQTSSNSANADSPIDSIGWFHGNCIAINNPNIQKGSEINLVSINGQSTVIKAQILEKVFDDLQCWPLSADRKHVNVDNGKVSFYRLFSDTDLNLGIGIVIAPGNKSNILDINKDGVIDKFYTCTSAEGIHFKISNGATDSLIWTGYYYLGYDIEASCP